MEPFRQEGNILLETFHYNCSNDAENQPMQLQLLFTESNSSDGVGAHDVVVQVYSIVKVIVKISGL